MKKYIGKRIMISLVTLLIIILVLFMLLQLMPDLRSTMKS